MPKAIANPSALLKAKEVADILGVSQRQVWRLVSACLLPKSVRIGGCTRWRLSDINAWIDAGCPDQAKNYRASALFNLSSQEIGQCGDAT